MVVRLDTIFGNIKRWKKKKKKKKTQKPKNLIKKNRPGTGTGQDSWIIHFQVNLLSNNTTKQTSNKYLYRTTCNNLNAWCHNNKVVVGG